MAEGSDVTAVLLRIEGRVQAVWYRGWTVDEALARGLRGWVRNRTDGTVEALLIGPQPAVRDMIAACHDGPRAARVSRITETPAADDGETGFQQRPTV